MRISRRIAAMTLLIVSATVGQADESRTSLIIEGGGLPPYCPALERLVKSATINGKLRIGYLPTASGRPEASARQFVRRLMPYGVRPEQIQTIDITVANAGTQAEAPAVVAQIRECTAIFFGGGDQTRITRALRQPDGTPTAALEAIYSVWRGGGVIAGTSAGAAVQSEAMIAVSGMPDDTIDDGMDPLDFGLTKRMDQPARRGLLVTRGLGFLRDGIIDQHFSQYRGRLGRLARATIEGKIRFGIGIDEDAAVAVDPEGRMEVLGPGHVTIIDSAGASCRDGALGCRITGVQITCLGHGDRFDTQTGKAILHPDKRLLAPGMERNNGNFQIPDIAGRGAVLLALIEGLGHNTSRRQLGITLRHNRHHGHGYRHTFTKTDQSQLYLGQLNGVEVTSVTNIRLDIDPVSVTLRSPAAGLPADLPQGPSRAAFEAITFRGIMLADDHGHFRPDAAITRCELACAIAHVIRLEPPRTDPPVIKDLPAAPEDAHEIALVVAAELMTTDQGLFRPESGISRQEAADVLVRLAERYRSNTLPNAPVEFADLDAITTGLATRVFAANRAGLLTETAGRIRPTADLTRGETVEALFALLDFSWGSSVEDFRDAAPH